MAALITLSIDMKELHATDKFGNINSFDLTANAGVIISSTNGKINVSTATSTPSGPVTEAMSGNKWQISYYEPTDIALLIGAISIEGNLTEGHHTFDLSQGDLQLWNDGSNLKAKLV